VWVAIPGYRNAHGGSFLTGGVRIVSYETHVFGRAAHRCAQHQPRLVHQLRLRFTAGVCVLAASLLIGSTGVAVADADSGNSAAHGGQGSNTSGQQPSTGAKKPKDEPGGTDAKDGSLSSSGHSVQQPSTGAKKPKDETRGTDTKDETKDHSDLGAAVPDLVAAVSNEVAPVPDVVASVPVAVASVPVAVASVPVAVAPVPVAVAPVPKVVGPVSNVSALVQDILAPVGGTVVPLTQLPSDLYSALLGIAGAPGFDVRAFVQDMLSVGGAVVLLAQLPSDLFSFLLGIVGMQPVVAEVAGIHGPGLSAAAGASVASRWPLGRPLAGSSGPPVAGVSVLPGTSEATRVATPDVIALGRASAASEMARPAPEAAFPIRAGSAFPHVVGEILLTVSLWALAAAALPGVGGLGFITLAGVRVGYRQAKAGGALRTTGIAHFARPGPLGIIRSGSLVVVRPRALRVVRPRALGAEHLLDKVA
jgi:hypothetical protein